MERKTFSQLPLGVSDFHKLRELEKIYVDKTGLLYELITTFEKFFLLGLGVSVSRFWSLPLNHFSNMEREISKGWRLKNFGKIKLTKLSDWTSPT